jgi:hypothetical protein
MVWVVSNTLTETFTSDPGSTVLLLIVCVCMCVCVCVCVQVYVCKPQLPVVQILHFLKCIFFTTNRLVG